MVHPARMAQAEPVLVVMARVERTLSVAEGTVAVAKRLRAVGLKAVGVPQWPVEGSAPVALMPWRVEARPTQPSVMEALRKREEALRPSGEAELAATAKDRKKAPRAAV